MSTFPSGDLDRPDRILAYLGTFWSRSYDGAGQLLAYADGLGRATARLSADLDEAIDCLGVATVPTLHRLDWLPVAFAASALATPTAPAAYGGGEHHGDGTAYGGTVPASGARAPFSGPSDVPLILDAVDGSSVTLVDGLDYVLDGTTITFAVDPAADPRWSLTPVYSASGAVVDAELTAWLYRPGTDLSYAADHFGYALGLIRPSSDAYRGLLVALWDSLVLGPSAAVLGAAVAAIVGAPATASDGEVVEAVEYDGRGLFVATDQQIYRYPAGAVPIVAVGDVLAAGDPLSDASTVVDLSRGSAALPAGLVPALALPPGVLEPGFLGDLVAEDRDYPLAVGTDALGRTTVRFPLDGFPADVDEFWRRVDAAGTAAGATTLARLLDVRGPAAATEPTAASLPSTINPLRFLVDNVLRGAAMLVKVRAGSLPGGASGLSDLGLLRRVLPPGTLCLVLVDLPPLVDPAEAGTADSTSLRPGLPPIMEAVAARPDYATPPRVLSRVCQ